MRSTFDDPSLNPEGDMQRRNEICNAPKNPPMIKRINGRFVLCGYGWEQDYEHESCIHGIKLRWQCDWC